MISPIKIFNFCKEILNNIFKERCVFNFERAFPIGGAEKILQMTLGFCIENSFSHKYISSSIQNARVIQGIFTATPIEIAPLNLGTTSQ